MTKIGNCILLEIPITKNESRREHPRYPSHNVQGLWPNTLQATFPLCTSEKILQSVDMQDSHSQWISLCTSEELHLSCRKKKKILEALRNKSQLVIWIYLFHIVNHCMYINLQCKGLRWTVRFIKFKLFISVIDLWKNLLKFHDNPKFWSLIYMNNMDSYAYQTYMESI